jgi:mannose/fructose/N-acetylgalactosamine-specific phosphotransferase system component IID
MKKLGIIFLVVSLMLGSFAFANPFQDAIKYGNQDIGTIQSATKNPFSQAVGNNLNSETTLTAVNKVGNTSFQIIYTLGLLFIPIVGIITTIVLLVISIKSRNRLVNNISGDAVNHVYKKAIILLVLSIICLSVPGIILSLISFVIMSKAKKEIDINLESVKSKVNISSILNIISIVILAISFTFLLWVIFGAGASLLNIVGKIVMPSLG